MSHKITITCRLCSLAALSLLFCLTLKAQTDFSAVDQLLKQNEKNLGKDYVALVWKDGKLIYQHQGGIDFTPKTSAPIINSGNWLIAALALSLQDEGKISLDDKITRYLPTFGKYMKGYITIRNCLTHTTGVKGDVEGPLKVEKPLSHGTLEEEVDHYATKRDIVTNPGTEFFYSSIGPNTVARALEAATKKTFDRLIMEKIIRPLKMRGTSFSGDDGSINPAGGARSTANDYINFLSMLLNKGMFEGKRILSEKAVAELLSLQLQQLPVKYAPQPLTGLKFCLGSFAADNGSATPTAFSCPNFAGTIPFIDVCRNYAAILIVAKPDDNKKDLYPSLRNLIDQALGSCK